MGKNVKLLTTRGIIAVCLTLAFITLSVSEKDTTNFLPVYFMVIGYLFGKDDNTTNNSSTK